MPTTVPNRPSVYVPVVLPFLPRLPLSTRKLRYLIPIFNFNGYVFVHKMG